jgi:acyl-CoA synthetase (AMP-forming)/AMP-acid ligase II
VTPAYFEMPEETENAKIMIGDKLWHRMGDVGYLDQENNLWFMGRKTHQVKTDHMTTHYSIQVEAIFNQHQDIKRTALIKIFKNNIATPALAIERRDAQTEMSKSFLEDLKKMAASSVHTQMIQDFFLHSGFPVDVRHNIKIDRIKLSKWAQKLR